METPKTQAGRITEEIMRIFWDEVPLETAQYNKVYSHVLATLDKNKVGQ